MSDVSQGPGWWQASDGKWYPPRDAAQAPAPGWWLASDGNWYPPRESEEPPHPGWWLAADGKWYPPESPTEPEPTTETTAEPTVQAITEPDPAPDVAPEVEPEHAPAPDGAPAAAESATKGHRAGPRAPRSVAEVNHLAATVDPPAHHDASSQIQRRNDASRADAIAQAPARFLAASRAVKLLESEVGRAPAAAPTRSRPANRMRAADLGADQPDPTDSTDPTGSTDRRDGLPEPVVARTPKPAPTPEPAVDEAADAAPAAPADPPPPAPDGPLLEVRSSPLGADIEHLGDHLVVYADRVELRDRTDRVRRRLRDREISQVSVQRKFTGAVLTVEAGTGDPIVLKGIKPDQADEVARLIQTRLRQGRPADPRPEVAARATARLDGVTEPDVGSRASAPSADAVANAAGRLAILNRDRLNEADLLRKLADLHRAGVLSDAEFEDKIALVGRLVSGVPLLIG